MNLLSTHLWKEWRQQRAVLLGIVVAVPLLSAATFVGLASFGTRLAPCAPVFTGGAAAMTALALCVELFAGEVTRSTIGFWRRQPRGLAVGWWAKLLLLAVSVTLATAWGGLSFWCSCRFFVGARAASAAWSALGTPLSLLVPLGTLALATWVLLATTWVSRGAAAVGLAVLLLGGVGFPGFLLWGERTAFLATLVPSVPVAALAGIAFPAAVATLSLFVGRRRGDRPLRATLVSFAVIALGAGAAYAHVGGRLERWEDVRIDDPDAKVKWIYVGSGGRMAYPWVTRVGDEDVSRSFAVDVESGATRALGVPRSVAFTWLDVPQLRSAGPGVGLLEIDTPPDEIDSTKQRMELIDGPTGRSLGSFPRRPLEGEALEIVRRHRRATTPVRTSDGRRAWTIIQVVPRHVPTKADGPWAIETWIERERADGGVDRTVFPQETRLTASYAMPCGWLANKGPGDASVFLPADARSVDDCLPFSTRTQTQGGVDNDALRQRIDARRFVYRRMGKKAADPRSWRVVDVVSKTDDPAIGLDGDDDVLALDGEDALVWHQAWRPQIETPAQGSVVRVRLDTGERVAATVGDGVPLDLRFVSLVGRTPHGATIIRGVHGGACGYLVFDPTTNRLERWTPTSGSWWGEVALIPDEDTLFVITQRGSSASPDTWSQQLESVRLGTRDRTVLFPR